jgi:hypothetical protein
MIDRRQFIKVMAGGSSVVVIPSLLGACGNADTEVWLEGWKGPMGGETDIRRVVLSYAILAANSHNTQPWIVDLTGPNGLDLYVDKQRLLPETDPPARQIHISQGTFLENLELAASQHGYRASIDYFPKGDYSNTVIEDKPVASVTLNKEASSLKDPLFGMILNRQSNKRAYAETPLTAEQLTGLRSARIEPRVRLTISDDAGVRQALSEIMIEAMRIETLSKSRDAETIAMFRFNDEERRQYRDGFGVAQSGMSGFKGWVAESFFLSREDAEKDSTSFGEQAVDMTADQAQSAAAYGWISTASNTRLDQVVTGRTYERLNLTAAALGVAMHPMSQVLQEYSDMQELQKRFLAYLNIPEGHTVQMLFRLGVAEPVEHSPRRSVKDLQRA